MLRRRIINFLIKNRDYKSYLEIGLSWPHYNYTWIKCEHKESCDPYPPSERDSKLVGNNLPDSVKEHLTYLMTSDEMFEQMPEDKKYDVVFIDGLHTEEQCCKDIMNAMKHLNPGGVILVHDTIPFNEESQKEDSNQLMWVGSVWKSVARLNRTNINFYTLKEDVGCTVIEYNEHPDFSRFTGGESYDYNRDFSNELMHVITDKKFREIYGKKNILGNDVPLNLIAHFEIDSNQQEISATDKLHFECIEYYKNLYSSVLFVLSVDKGVPLSLIEQYKKRIYKMGIYGDISIKLQLKNGFKEGATFYKEIGMRLSVLNGITAFVHNKGYGTYDSDAHKISVTSEITSSYYQLFEDFDYVKKQLSDETQKISYGAFLFNHGFNSAYEWGYFNGFQCINTKKLFNLLTKHNYIVPFLNDGEYTKTFLSNIIPFNFSLIDSASNGTYLTNDVSFMDENSIAASYFIFGENNEDYDLFTEDINQYED